MEENRNKKEYNEYIYAVFLRCEISKWQEHVNVDEQCYHVHQLMLLS